MPAKGKSWEIQLSLWHRIYGAHRNCIMFKAHPEAKMVSGKLIYSAKGPPDFIGVLPDGRAVAFDAKDVKKPSRGTISMSVSKLPEHQVNALRRVHQAGGVAFWAVRFDKVPYILTWTAFESILARGQKAIHVSDCLPMLPDGWLSVIQRECGVDIEDAEEVE